MALVSCHKEIKRARSEMHIVIQLLLEKVLRHVQFVPPQLSSWGVRICEEFVLTFAPSFLRYTNVTFFLARVLIREPTEVVVNLFINTKVLYPIKMPFCQACQGTIGSKLHKC